MFDFYLNYEYWFAATQLALAMLGMGATLKVRDFVAVAKNPWAISVGVVVQVLAVPLVAYVLLAVFSLDTGIAIGLALCAAIPGGTMSNVFTFLGRGHIALSIALTGVTTVACLVTTPIVLGFLISEHMPADFSMPAASTALEIALILLLPLVLGMILLMLAPGIAPRISKICIRASFYYCAYYCRCYRRRAGQPGRIRRLQSRRSAVVPDGSVQHIVADTLGVTGGAA